MLTRRELAELVHETFRQQGRAIETMLPADLERYADTKERLQDEALAILNDQTRLWDHPVRLFDSCDN